jgi:1-deoxyxylulose-5-phosphate synthase
MIPSHPIAQSEAGKIILAPMRRVALGRSGIDVSEVLLGCGSIGGIGSALETLGHGLTDAEAFAMLDEAFALGVNVLDTANSYAGGHSERIVGRWLAERQRDVLVATKVGNPVEPGQEGIDLSPGHIQRQVAGSLERLALDRIDLYLSHAPDEQLPIAKTLEAFAALIESGRVRAIGACNVSTRQLDEALKESDRLGLPRYEWVQNEYSLLARGDESGVLAICRDHGLGYTPYSPLCGGILSGKYRPGAAVPPGSRAAVRPSGYQGYMSASVLGAVRRLADEAARTGISAAGLALAWVVSSPDVTAPIVAPRRPDQWDAVREALDWRMDTDERDRIGKLLDVASS